MSNTMPMSTRVKLSAMMFLQFMMFAVYWAQLVNYVTNKGWSSMTALILATMPLGAIASPLIGMIADRFFNSEKVLAFANLLSAVMLFMAARATTGGEVFICLLVSLLFYMPTWSLTATIAMANSPAEQFPQIRVFGSIGWVASMLFSLVAMRVFKTTIDGTAIPFYCGAAVSVVAAVVALLCPPTPPKGKGEPMSVIDALGLRALSMMKDRNFAVFMLVSFLAMIPFNIHFAFLGSFLASKGIENVTVTTYIGQAAEMVLMLLVTVFIRKFGVKWSLVAGLAALVVRYAAYYVGADGFLPAIYLGILVHGVIFGFFVVGGQVYVGKKAPADIQGQAQGFYGLMTFGFGTLVGTFANNALINHFTAPVKHLVAGKEVTLLEGSWDKVWLVTLACSVVLLVLMAVFFNPKLDEKKA